MDMHIQNHVINVLRRADYMQGTRISFRSKEDAIHFSEKQGISYDLVKRGTDLYIYLGWDYFVYVVFFDVERCTLLSSNPGNLR